METLKGNTFFSYASEEKAPELQKRFKKFPSNFEQTTSKFGHKMERIINVFVCKCLYVSLCVCVLCVCVCVLVCVFVC